MKTCPSCGSELELIGDHGIVDWDANWDAQAMKYRCVKGLHIVFLVDSRDIDEELTTPWVKARDAIHHTVGAALWETPFRFANLEDFRNELSNVAMKAFENYKNSTQAYDYIDAAALPALAFVSFREWRPESTPSATKPLWKMAGKPSA